MISNIQTETEEKQNQKNKNIERQRQSGPVGDDNYDLKFQEETRERDRDRERKGALLTLHCYHHYDFCLEVGRGVTVLILLAFMQLLNQASQEL